MFSGKEAVFAQFSCSVYFRVVLLPGLCCGDRDPLFKPHAHFASFPAYSLLHKGPSWWLCRSAGGRASCALRAGAGSVSCALRSIMSSGSGLSGLGSLGNGFGRGLGCSSVSLLSSVSNAVCAKHPHFMTLGPLWQQRLNLDLYGTIQNKTKGILLVLLR